MMTFNSANYKNNIHCEGALHLDFLYSSDYQSLLPQTDYSLAADLRSFLVAFGINMNVYTKENCNADYSRCLTVVEEQVVWGIRFISYSDRRYVGMKPVVCEVHIDEHGEDRSACFVQIGAFILYPVFNHLGESLERPQYCECGSSSSATDLECQSFNLNMGFITYNSFNDSTFVEDSLSPLLQLVKRYNASDLNRIAYEVMFPDILYQGRDKTAFYDFCYDGLLNKTCSILQWSTIKSSYFINDDFYQLKYGSCNKSFLTPNWANVVYTPPVPLVENYKKCVKQDSQAFFDSLGVAVGNASSIGPLLIILTIQIMLVVRKLLNLEWPAGVEAKFTIVEKDDIIDGFAEKLLQVS